MVTRVDMITSKAKRAWAASKEIARATPRTIAAMLVPAAISGGLIYEAYRILRPEPNPQQMEYKKPTTAFSPALAKTWDHWKKSFITKVGKAAFVFDPSKIVPGGDKPVVSEGMAFGMLMAIQHNDRETFDMLFEGLKEMEGRGLPAFHGSVNGKFHVGKDADFASASDADQDIAYALIQAHTLWDKEGKSEYKDKSVRYLKNIWEREVESFGGNFFLLKPSEDWGSATESAGTAYNVSYPSLHMFETFQAFDPSAGHRWADLARDTLTLRKAIIEASSLKTGKYDGNGREIVKAKASYADIPDWVSVAWSPERGIELYTFSTASQKTGYDGIRTAWRMAYDAVHLKDPFARAETIELARKMIDAAKDKNIPEELRIIDEIGQELKGRVMALSAYTALAFAASQTPFTLSLGALEHCVAEPQSEYTPIYERLAAKLQALQQEDGSFKNTASGQDDLVAKRYFDQTTVWFALNMLACGDVRFAVDAFFGSGELPGKEGQVLRAKHNRGWFIHAEYLPLWAGKNGFIIDPQERAELDAVKRFVWLYDEGETLRKIGIRKFSDERTLAIQVETAGQLKALRYFYEAINQYGLVLGNSGADKPEISRKALGGLNGSIADAGLPSGVAVAMFENLEKANPDSSYVKLGLANALASTYLQANYGRALTILGDIAEKETEDVILRTKILQLTADIKVRQADFAGQTGDPDGKQQKYQEALDLSEKALSEAKNADKIDEPLLALTVEVQRAQILSQMDKKTEAIGSFEDILADTAEEKDDIDIAEVRLNLTLGLSSALRETKQFQKALGIVEAEALDHAEATDPAHLMLETERIRILSAQGADQKAISDAIIEAAQSTPKLRLRGSFERFAFFVDSLEFRKAIKDLNQLARMAKALNDGAASLWERLLKDENIASLKSIQGFIRSELEPKTAGLKDSPKEKAIKDALHSQLAGKLGSIYRAFKDFSKTLPQAQAEEIMRFIVKLQRLLKEGKYEAIAEHIERLEELYVFIRELENLGDGNSLENEKSILETAALLKALLPSGSSRNISNETLATVLSIASEAAQKCEETLGEKPLTPKYFEAVFGQVETAAWELYNSGRKQEAEQLLLELMSEGYAMPDGPLYTTILSSMRSKDVRGGLNALIGHNSALKSRAFEAVGTMAASSDPQKAIGYYRQALGLKAEQKDIQEERREYLTLLKDQPEKQGTIRKMLKLKTGNTERDKMFDELTLILRNI